MPVSLAPPSLLTFGRDFALQLLPSLLQTAQEAQRVHAKAGQAGVAVQETLSALEELLRLMSRFCAAAVGRGWRQVPAGLWAGVLGVVQEAASDDACKRAGQQDGDEVSRKI